MISSMCVYVLYVSIKYFRGFFGGEEKPVSLVRRAVNETSRVGSSYYTLGIQREGLLLKVGGIVRHPEGFSWLSMQFTKKGRYGNLCFLLVNVYPY